MVQQKEIEIQQIADVDNNQQIKSSQGERQNIQQNKNAKNDSISNKNQLDMEKNNQTQQIDDNNNSDIYIMSENKKSLYKRIDTYLFPNQQKDAKILLTQSKFTTIGRLLIIRTIFFLYSLAINLHASITQDAYFPLILKYLTYQSGISITFVFGYLTLETFYIWKKKKDDIYTNNFWKFSYLFYNFVIMTQPIIVIMYWLFLATEFNVTNFSAHGIWLIFILVEFSINSIPTIIKHLGIMEVFILFALIINCIVTVTSDEPVYDIITYTDFATYIYLIVVILVANVTFYISYKVSQKLKSEQFQIMFYQ